MATPPGKPLFSPRSRITILILCLVILISWLVFTPSGLLGKSDAVGYAVCHRIPSHSFFLGERQMPLCARCSGMHLGSLLGFIYLARRGKRGGMPKRSLLIVLGIFLLLFALDGINSYISLGQESGKAISLFSKITPLYTPQNWLRMLTGLWLGLGIAAVLVPVFNQTLWADWSEEPALDSWRSLGILVALSLLLEVAMLSNNSLLLYPLALLSSFTVLVTLGLIYTIVWVMLVKRENQFTKLSQVWVLLTVGFFTAVLQIGVMDYGRYLLTGTWQGFFN